LRLQGPEERGMSCGYTPIDDSGTHTEV
jgi:hypothetical protein